MIDDSSGSADAKFQQAFSLHQQGRLGEARNFYEQVLRAHPAHFNALHLFGVLCLQSNLAQPAVDLIANALRVNPNHALAHHHYANALCQLQRYEPAIASYDRAIALDGQLADAYHARGLALFYLRKAAAALDSYNHALALDPKNGAALYNRGIALAEVGRNAEAIASFEAAVGVMPNSPEANTLLGHALRDLRRFEAAFLCYDRAVALDVNYAAAYNGGAMALFTLRRFKEAIAGYDKAIASSPGNAGLHFNRAQALDAIGRHAEAILSYDQTLHVDPTFKYAAALRLQARLQICDWRGTDEEIARLSANIEQDKPAAPPFCVLQFSSSAKLQQKAAEIWTREEMKVKAVPLAGGAQSGARLRIGYFSSDFYQHAVAYQLAEVIELHDRSKFEVSAFSFGPDTQDTMRRRLQAAFEHFLDVREKSDEEIVQLARDRQLDIAVDLKGYTQDARPGLFAQRLAPLQVSYLGYPGTMGASFMDYIVADAAVIPVSSREFYREKVLSLPACFFPSDGRRAIADKLYARTELGLPSAGFVFCCFNNSVKISPQIFDVWMQILRRVDASVLWLRTDDRTVVDNLRAEAQRRGVDGNRLIFAPRTSMSQHLARHRSADLFLDSLPYNAHTTASDALWAGLPVLTSPGEGFASRVAASLLQAADLAELVASDLDDYREIAVELAGDPPRLASFKERLLRAHRGEPLFDTRKLATDLEKAYQTIQARHQLGLAAAHIDIS
ncbi:MAG TPA: tetratricopeptide repeat protein [Steroidobacteraceae bacterium]|nr:tetratricopeptide repeat protein [Steroidobacteraceae bacterium]